MLPKEGRVSEAASSNLSERNMVHLLTVERSHGLGRMSELSLRRKHRGENLESPKGNAPLCWGIRRPRGLIPGQHLSFPTTAGRTKRRPLFVFALTYQIPLTNSEP